MASRKILVIDDSRVIRMRVREMLPTGDFEVLEAKDGIDGITKINDQHPNLIMLDFLLPRMSGWDVFQQIQAESSLRHIPLVIMSGRKEEVTEKIPEPFEYFEFIEKPFEKKELIEAIKSAMIKARNRPPVLDQAPSAGAEPAAAAAGAEEIEALKQQMAAMQAASNKKMAAMQGEIDTLKKQLAQIVNFIKQKLK